MLYSRILCAVTFAAIVGCADDPIDPGALGSPDEAVDLVLTWPALSAKARTPAEIVEVSDSRPAGIISDTPDDDGPPENVSATIIGPITRVGFTPTYAYSNGRHSYTGNVGRVTTEARVTFDGQTLGVQPAERQNAAAFMLDWGEIKSIWAEAYVFTDQSCGLRVNGSSLHYAWWQWFMGGPAPRWGDASASSQAFPPASQPGCAEDPIPDSGGNSSTDGGSDHGDMVTCWYWVTYDPYTGEIYDAQFLYCDDVEGG